MNIKMSDVNKRRTGAIIAAIAVIAGALLMLCLLFYLNTIDPAPKAVMVLMTVVFGGIIIGVTIALIQRLREVKGGEIDEARKY